MSHPCLEELEVGVVLRQRVVSALLGIPLLIWVSYMGGNWFLSVVGIIILLGLNEYGNMMGNRGYKMPKIAGILSGLLVMGAAAFPELFNYGVVFPLILLHALFIIFGGADFDESAFSFAGAMFFAWTLSHLILIRETFPQGFYYIALCFIITWSTDTGAYFFGRFFGRHKLSPVISPNKTVEGAVGGTLLCVMVVFLLKGYFAAVSLQVLVILTVLGSVAGQIGDLLESAVKRWSGVKDSGSIIPGHGGMLDRFDSLTLVAPLMYYLLKPFLVG